MDYYDILGVSRTATENEIRKAYKAKSMKHHPDRGGNEEEFKKINEAYSTLKDPKKKQMYDQFGTNDPQQAGFNQQEFNGFGDINDVLAQMFGQGRSTFETHFGQRRQQRQPKNKTLNINYEITLEEAFNGKDILFEIPLPSGRKQ